MRHRLPLTFRQSLIPSNHTSRYFCLSKNEPSSRFYSSFASLLLHHRCLSTDYCGRLFALVFPSKAASSMCLIKKSESDDGPSKSGNQFCFGVPTNPGNDPPIPRSRDLLAPHDGEVWMPVDDILAQIRAIAGSFRTPKIWKG
jgi:hypothetical protein